MLKKINELIDTWMPEILPYGCVSEFENYIKTKSAGSGTPQKYEFKCRAYFYTDRHKYCISAIEANDRTYLGAVLDNRAPWTGEGHTRGCDLPDGELTYETWCKIKNSIIAHELQKLEPNSEWHEDTVEINVKN